MITKLEYGLEEQEEEISRTMGCLREEIRGNVVEQNRASTSTMYINTLGSHKWSLQKVWPSVGAYLKKHYTT